MAEILVVDDDSQTIEQTCRLIADLGHGYDFLVESRYLVAKLEARPTDLILLDVNMPEVDGLTLLQEIKSHPQIAEIPVIMVTGERGEELISRCFALGAVDFIGKPIRPLELQSRVRIALETRQHILAIRKTNAELTRANAFSQAIINSMEEAIMVINKQDFSLEDANRVFFELVGKPKNALIGNVCYSTGRQVLHPCHPCHGYTAACVLEDTLLTGQGTNREFEYRDEKGEARYTRMITLPINPPGMESEQILLIARDITRGRRLRDKFKHLAFHDVLTGLPNRQLFHDRIHQSLARSRRYSKLMAVMYFDLDRFKEINDTLGHDVGDLLLIEVAKRLTACVRRSDTIARLGGDEFTAVLNEVESKLQVKNVAHKILKNLEEPFYLDGHTVNITSSIGVAFFPRDGETLESLTKCADQALYWAKGAGRNNVQFFSDTLGI